MTLSFMTAKATHVVTCDIDDFYLVSTGGFEDQKFVMKQTGIEYIVSYETFNMVRQWLVENRDCQLITKPSLAAKQAA